MAVELTVLEAVMSSILAFLGGLFGLLAYYRLRQAQPHADKNGGPAYLKRLEYYENQVIDLKIRLDALSLYTEKQDGGGGGGVAANMDGMEAETPASSEGVGGQTKLEPQQPVEKVPGKHIDLTNHILCLITDKSLTSRDIQVTTGRTREHVSRQMKKMAELGLVKRRSSTRPFIYSITELGRAKLEEGGS